MNKLFLVILIVCFLSTLFTASASADSRKTWANVGKGLAIYEGVKVLTGRQGNIVDDVTGGMKPAGSSTASQSGGGSYDDAYNAGYKAGYEAGYNAGFRGGVQHDSGQ